MIGVQVVETRGECTMVERMICKSLLGFETVKY
jgi:hypothetical protein